MFTVDLCLEAEEFEVVDPTAKYLTTGLKPSLIQSTRKSLSRAKHQQKNEQPQEDEVPDPFNDPTPPMPPLTPPTPGTPLPDLPF